MNVSGDEYSRENVTGTYAFEDDYVDQLPTLPVPVFGMEQIPSQLNVRLTNENAHRHGYGTQDSLPFYDMQTWYLPVVHAKHIPRAKIDVQAAGASDVDSYILLIRNLVKSSGVYALSAIAGPLISLALAPFLTHSLSPTDYGILTILSTAISLGAGITQMGLATAFFRAYNYDYTSPGDRRYVLATTTLLLCLISIPVAIGAAIGSSYLADLLLGSSVPGSLIVIAAGVLVVQNLSVPGFAWLRAESRALFYSLLSVSNVLITLIANLVLVGVFHWGITGSLIAMGLGYSGTVLCTMPFILLHAGARIRIDIARSMLSFGAPLVLNVISYWVLQVLDRYLLSRFGSLAQTAMYAVVYTLGSALSVVVIAPFTLAWPTAMFAIAKRDDASQAFRLLFRWLCIVLLFSAFGLSLAGQVLLDWLFPPAYHAEALIIPVVAVSIAFYGVYFIFMIGANITRKTWLGGVFVTIAAIVNTALNLVLIPQDGAMGAALATLVAYAVLAAIAYVVNQRIYPIPFEIDIFIAALLVGAVLYLGSEFLVGFRVTESSLGIFAIAVGLYTGILILLGKLPYRHVPGRNG
ncbi:MAG TPA: polysaccharide biosynthesis C-terminal domain-containing protein [Ktedonobacteraceae bacterium]|nr:polysaccharide biosynthesis C-terminal domain-containing protein [Ktedonobacteraceae bacterium]